MMAGQPLGDHLRASGQFGRTMGLALAYGPRTKRRKLRFGNRQLALRISQPPAVAGLACPPTADLLDVTS